MTPGEHGLKATLNDLEINEKIVKTKEDRIAVLTKEADQHRADIATSQAVIEKCRKRLSKHTGE